MDYWYWGWRFNSHQMKFRKLRIALSVTWGVACLLLIVLWVRSFYFGDVILWSVTKWNGLQFTST